MTINEGYRYICAALSDTYDSREAENIAAMAIEKITGLKRIDRLLSKNQDLTPQQKSLLAQYAESLSKHRPIQYVLGEAWFYGIPLYVDEHVLVPRPETEELVDWIVYDTGHRLQETGDGISILDIGTGSGCIAIALKKNITTSDVYAIDISENALAVARQNAMDQQTIIQFLNVDILDPAQSAILPQFDIIVSNPPYIPVKDKKEMHKNVLDHEPHTALFVEDNDPLLFYTAIISFAKLHLHPNGCIYAEMHETMGEAVKSLFALQGFTQSIIKKDMQGKDRMIKATKIN